MAVISQQIEMLGCDVEGCEIKAPAIDGQLPAKFETGEVQIATVDGPAVVWVACRETHIGKAVVAAKARAIAAVTADTDEGEQPADDEPQRDETDPEPEPAFDSTEDVPEFATTR